ncbi:MAG: glycosyltransferase [Bryobacterales bacterium]|nr:glycosyltransferase [Bryobacterales bacterium]
MSARTLAGQAWRIFTNLGGALLIVLVLPAVYSLLLLSGATGWWMRKRLAPNGPATIENTDADKVFRPPASIVIPNWNGRDLLEKYLPSVIAACDFSRGDELIVVDNASADGSSEVVVRRFPQVRLVQLAENLGFGGGSNAGIRAATNSFVVLLNSDMRVEPDFLAPLLSPFSDPAVFAVTAQILFSDPAKRREESGLTYARWRHGEVELGHDLRADVPMLYPCFYPGGGSSAFDREKFLSIGGFAHLYRPFYLEDTDLGWEAWKRGWKVLYAPESVVYHEHRGTIGKRFQTGYINTVVEKNRILFHWKHVLHPGALATYCISLVYHCCAAVFDGRHQTKPSGRAAIWALLQFPEVLLQRWSSARMAVLTDGDSLKLHRPDVYHDRFRHPRQSRSPLNVLFLSPYPIYPPHHGGAALMSQTLHHLAKLCNVHLVVMLEEESECAAHIAESSRFASIHLLVRPPAQPSTRLGLLPKAVREFALPELRQLLERLIFERSIDVLQLEYTNMAQYAKPYSSVLTALFEHDIYFQSVARRVRKSNFFRDPVPALEYLRALHFELKAVNGIDYIQVCTATNASVLEGYSPQLAFRTDPTLRAGIEIGSYPYATSGRDQDTILFVGNFRHIPNQEGLRWLLDSVMPDVMQRRPATRLRVVGPNAHLLGLPLPHSPWLDVLGAVDDVRPHLAHCAAFVCPVLTGSGVRVKLLEAFAAGIPVVATSIGAEGLVSADCPVCAIADSAPTFADAVVGVLQKPEGAAKMAKAARELVEEEWDAEKNTHRLVARYHELLEMKAVRRADVDARDAGIPGRPQA